MAGKPTPYNYQTSNNGANNLKAFQQNQAIAFVHENDIYYKPKVQGELVCRITTTGESIYKKQHFSSLKFSHSSSKKHSIHFLQPLEKLKDL